MKKHMQAVAVAIVFLLALSLKITAQKNQIEKSWFDEGKSSKVQIYPGNDGKFYGKIVWLKDPIDKATGKPQTDVENPDPKLRNRPVMNMVILTGFIADPTDRNVYTGGKIYDPDSGKTYCGKITFKGSTLDLRGYLCSFSIFGKTETWTEAK
jgi:uncharacterized protein (DUF2147 family)